MIKTIQFKSLSFNNIDTFATAALFIIGNLLLPQMFHFVPQGGATWLPIYFFTLIGAYAYGWRVGILTAVLSPVINCFLFAMPPMAVLPAILVKSIFLAFASAFIASRFNKVTLGLLVAVVMLYQVFGTIGEWMLVGDFRLACQDFRVGIPGMILQIIGGYWILRRE